LDYSLKTFKSYRIGCVISATSLWQKNGTRKDFQIHFLLCLEQEDHSLVDPTQDFLDALCTVLGVTHYKSNTLQ